MRFAFYHGKQASHTRHERTDDDDDDDVYRVRIRLNIVKLVFEPVVTFIKLFIARSFLINIYVLHANGLLTSCL